MGEALKLEMEGADESTTFTDTSGRGHTVTAKDVGTYKVEIDTAQKAVGNSSAKFYDGGP